MISICHFLVLSAIQAALYVADKLGVEKLILQIKGSLGTQEKKTHRLELTRKSAASQM